MLKQIPDHPDYAVSDSGKVYKITNDGLVELNIDISTGYPRVRMEGTRQYVSYLVADAFLDPPTKCDQQLFFVDGNRCNCSKDNLVWLTHSETQRYSAYTVEYRQKVLRGRA